ncbi:hypothetical protein [Micromonospora tulbaghiae]|uniref:hypothetical protein n=1 Tax=Micromonospora tulbaghiae TaxID=479978 RepID=UPI001FD4F2A1|nr:hypothetical protein [Micromonospora tulbaghiae]
MNSPRLRLLSCLAVPLLAACGTEPSGTVAEVPPPAYTCCQDLDVDRPYQPGQTLTVQWTVKSPDEPGSTSPQVELTARLTGLYGTVDDLKAASAAPGLVTFTATPVRPSGTPGERSASTIVIGPAAKPGFYDLVTSVIGDGNTTASGSSIIQVAPKP